MPSNMSGLQVGFVCVPITIAAAVVPFSACFTFPTCVCMLCYFIGRRANASEEEENGPGGWMAILIALSMFCGSLLNIGFLFFIAKTGK